MAENTKKWEETGRRYRTYIKLEKRLSQNTVESYMRDLRQFAHFILRQYDVAPRKVEGTMIERYMAWLFDRGREKTSQARCLCGIRSFFNFLLVNDQIESSPAEFVDTPKFGRPLPDILTTDEIDSIIATVDMRSTKGLRDSAMLEVLYSCGLRVSEPDLAAAFGPLFRRRIHPRHRQRRQTAAGADQQHGAGQDTAVSRRAAQRTFGRGDGVPQQPRRTGSRA